MTRPAAPESGKKIALGDALLEAYKLAERVIKPSSMYGATAQQLASALLTNKEITTEFAEDYETIKRQFSLAQTEIKGHMRIKDELKEDLVDARKYWALYFDRCIEADTRLIEAQARIAELEKLLGRWLTGPHVINAPLSLINETKYAVLKDRA